MTTKSRPQPTRCRWKPRRDSASRWLCRHGDVTAARQILEKILDQEPADLEIPAQDSVPAEPEPPLVSETELHPSVQVWFGTDDKIAQFLTAALEENQIPMHLETEGGTRISVSSAHEARAREIVREVTEAEPPK